MEHRILEKRASKVSLALILRDYYTNKDIIGRSNIVLEKKVYKYTDTISPIKNISGFYVFKNLDDGIYKLKIKSKFYMDFAENIELPYENLENGKPKIIDLVPSCAYPFEVNETLIRGILGRSEDKLLIGIGVTIIRKDGSEYETKSDDKGEVVVALKRVIDREVVDIKLTYKEKSKIIKGFEIIEGKVNRLNR